MNSIQKEQNQDKIDFLNLFGIDVFKLESTHLYPDNELYKYSIICNSKDLLQDLAENFEDKTNHINQLIKDNLKLIGEKDTYQLCPKCNGQGTLSKPPHLPDDITHYSSAQTTHECNLCGGKMVIQKPQQESLNQKFEDQFNKNKEAKTKVLSEKIIHDFSNNIIKLIKSLESEINELKSEISTLKK